MWATYEVWLLLSAVLIVLLAGAIVRDPEDVNARAALFLLASVLGHLLVPILRAKEAPAALLGTGLLLEASMPAAFWLLARAHFDDEFRLRPLHVGLWLLLVALGAVPALWPETRFTFWPLLPRLMSLGIVAHALFA